MTEEDHALEEAIERMEIIWQTAKEASERIRKEREEERVKEEVTLPETEVSVE